MVRELEKQVKQGFASLLFQQVNTDRNIINWYSLSGNAEEGCKVSTNIDVAEKWLSELQKQAGKEDGNKVLNEQVKTLKWLIKKAKAVKGLDIEKTDYKNTLTSIVEDDIRGFSSHDILGEIVGMASDVLKKHN